MFSGRDTATDAASGPWSYFNVMFVSCHINFLKAKAERSLKNLSSGANFTNVSVSHGN